MSKYELNGHAFERMSPRAFAKEFARAPVIYCSFGGVEYHGTHTWLGPDYFKGREICLRAAGMAGGVVHPTVPIVPGGAQMSFDELKSRPTWTDYPGVFGGGALCRALCEETLRFFAECLKFRVCVAFGSHGPAGKLLKDIAAEHDGHIGAMRLIAVGAGELCIDLLREAKARYGLHSSGAHGGLWETSMDMAEDPAAVDLKELDRPFDGFFVMPPDVVLENKLASAAFGEKLLQTSAERLADMVRAELAKVIREDGVAAPAAKADTGMAPTAPLALCQDRNAILEMAAAAGFDASAGNRIADEAARIGGQPALKELAARFMERAYGQGEKLTLADLPGVDEPLLFLETLGALLAPLIRFKHGRAGLPGEVTAESLLRIGWVCDFYKEKPEKLAGGLYWLGKYYREVMFNAGRFEYVIRPFTEKGTVSAYMHHRCGRVAVIASPGLRIDAEGLPAPDDADCVFVTERSDTKDVVRGNPVTPNGRVLQRVLELKLTEWACILKPGMPILDLHIPGGGGMDPDACGESLRRASEIMLAYLKRYGARSIVCQSWILNPDWETLLPKSNLTAFMRETYMYPLRAQKDSGISFIFGCPTDKLDLKTASRRTTLEKIMLERLERGQLLRAGGMLMAAEHAGWFFGTQYYRTAGAWNG